MFKKITFKYTFIIIAVITIISLIFIPVYINMQKSLFIEREKDRMDSFCDNLTKKIDQSSGTEAIEDYLEDNNESNYSVTIRDNNKEVIISSTNPGHRRHEDNRRPPEPGQNDVYLQSATAEYIDAIGPDFESITIKKLYQAQDDTIYYIQIRENLRNVESIFTFTNQILAIILIAYILVCSIIFILLTNRITRSIRDLTEAVIKIAAKNYSVRYEGNISSDEIGTLAENFNVMADTIQDNINQINNYNFLLKEDNEHLRESSRVRQRFVRNATHELKTPLAIISSQVEMINCAEDESKKAYYYNSALQEIQKMSKLITSLLNDSTDIHSSDTGTGAANIDLSKTIEELCDSCNGLMLTKKIVYTKDIDENCHSNITPENVEHVFNNYIMNAVKHTSPKGEISVSLKKKEHGCRLSVYNDGEAIPEDMIDRIWDEFFSEYNPEQKSGNSGLGLFIVREISHMYQTECGVITHEKGMEFWFDFRE